MSTNYKNSSENHFFKTTLFSRKFVFYVFILSLENLNNNLPPSLPVQRTHIFFHTFISVPQESNIVCCKIEVKTQGRPHFITDEEQSQNYETIIFAEYCEVA